MDGLPADRWGGGSIMTAVCYDVLNQVLFDETVLSICVFIVSPVSPSTKAGWWCVSVLVQRGVWGFALEWPAHLSGPRAEAVPGYRITDWIVVNLNLWNVSQAKKTSISCILCRRSELDSCKWEWVENVQRTSRKGSGCETGKLFYEWERGSRLSNVGGCSLFKPEDPVVGWHVWLFPAVKQALSERDGLQEFPLSSAVWMGCHTDFKLFLCFRLPLLSSPARLMPVD